jgi:hypothetical protein
MADDMVIMTRTFELLNWLLPRAEAFPRSYRYTLTRRIVNRTLDLNEQLIAAQSARGAARGVALQHADDYLQALRLYLRLIHRWRWINDGQYRHVSQLVAEIGRLLGGWRKRTALQK